MTILNLRSEPRTATVIIAEDESIIRMLAVEFLTDAGFNVIEAADANKALEILHSSAEEIDLLFTDINMPGPLNGLELAYVVHKTWPDIAILISSGRNSQPTKLGLPEGSKFMSKPYRQADVVRQVQTMIKH